MIKIGGEASEAIRARGKHTYISLSLYIYIYIYILCMYNLYIYIYTGKLTSEASPGAANAASFVLCVFRRVKDRYNLLHPSPLLKRSCV